MTDIQLAPGVFPNPRRPVAYDASRPVPTVGVEEEFFLLWPDGSPALVAPQLLALLPGRSHFQPEWMQFQVETVSGVCRDLAELDAQMRADRRVVATIASTYGAAMAATGTPPFGIPGRAGITGHDRYLALQQRFPEVAAEVVTCGCHVHVGVPDREAAVEALNRLRGWLPVLLALSGNSPIWRGRDSGWESFRHEKFRRWPSARLPPWCRDASAYDDALEERIAAGDAADPAGVYWLARLSPHFPTIEIRVADTGLTVADTVLLTALCRALVTTVLAEAAGGLMVPSIEENRVEASLANAARHGLRGLLLDPLTGSTAPGFAALYRLVEHVMPALRVAGDLESVSALLRERRRLGSGAARQRALWDVRDPVAFVAALAVASLSR